MTGYEEPCVVTFWSAIDATTTVDRAVSDLADLRAAVATLRDHEAELTDWLAAALGSNTITVDGVGVVQVRHATDRRAWDNDALIRLVIARGRDERRVDESTGEYESEGEAVGRALTECARPSWRVTALRARGIDPSEYCESTPGKTSVVISQ